MIVRLYESMNGSRSARITVPKGVMAAWRCSLAEEKQDALPLENGSIPLALRPFEIATIRLSAKS